VLIGAVKGGDVYGTFPTLALGGPDDANNRGVDRSVWGDHGEMVRRQPAAIPQVFPNLANFPVTDVGFMG